jgi:hypothetical protein
VAQKLIEHAGEIGCGHLLGLFQLGNMPADKARANMQAYTETVMPLINAALPNSKEPPPTPNWKGYSA